MDYTPPPCYKGEICISKYEHAPQKDEWYYCIVEEDNTIFMRYVKFCNGEWQEEEGEVLFWMENY